MYGCEKRKRKESETENKEAVLKSFVCCINSSSKAIHPSIYLSIYQRPTNVN